jgi:uncharacterized damage-inducible protein DinB
MQLTDILSKELEREGALSAKVLANVPTGQDDWRPHPKSMPLGRLASLVATMPSWLSMMIDRDDFDLNPPEGRQSSEFAQTFKTPAELVRASNDGIAGARSALGGTTDDHLMKTWQLKFGGMVVSEKLRHEFLQESINHLAHHRGQLTVYLRMNDAPVPATYGPSADEQRFE